MEDIKHLHKLTNDAQDRFEIDKQNRIKQYMDDIIQKLAAKNRKHRVTVKKKFIDEALKFYSEGVEKRSSQVYVIVINRDRDYDPVINQKIISQKNGIKRNLRLQKLEQAKNTKVKMWPESSDDEVRKENESKNDHKYASDSEFSTFKKA